MIPPSHITGLVLAGGQSSRMGGHDKGLIPLNGEPLIAHVLRRLEPQVGEVLISANRHLDVYRQWHHEVLADEPSTPDAEAFQGPLAGILAGLRHCPTPWLLCCPCDGPNLPLDLAHRLSQGLQTSPARAAVAQTVDTLGQSRLQPTYCLLHTSLTPTLEAFLSAGHRRIGLWLSEQSCCKVPFDGPNDLHAFANINTPEDCALWTRHPAPHQPHSMPPNASAA